MKRTAVGRNLALEIFLRNNCRHGLKDVLIEINYPGCEGRLYRIYATEWDEKAMLRISAFPENGPMPEPLHCVGTAGCITDGPFEVHSALCYAKPVYPDGMVRNLRPEYCILAAEWPVVCCRPDRRRAERFRPQAQERRHGHA
jgi:hypothetical protein